MAQLFILLFLFGSLAWFISWSMVGLLFYPKKTIHFLGISWQAPIIGWVKTLQIDQLIPTENLSIQLDQLMPEIDQKLDDFFRKRLSEKLPMISMFIGDKTIEQLKSVFMEELKNMFPELIQSFATNMQNELIHTLEQKSLDSIYNYLIKATAPFRKMAIFLGLTWGIVTYWILNFF
jgi:hypothetical protein